MLCDCFRLPEMEAGGIIRIVAVNQAQVGINDTPITRALEDGQFKIAQQLIIENTDRSYLDEGPFVKIPLTLVLSGDPEFRNHPRHLGLAKLLVEHGANPNLRIPNAELHRATPSAMECLINLISNTRDIILREGILSSAENGSSPLPFDGEKEITNPLRTIGLNGETNLSPQELREQLLCLLDIFLANGGDPNVTTTNSHSTLYHLAVTEFDPDMDVVLKLCEAGGDLNTPNGHGTTPLMDLISVADGDAAYDILKKIWAKNPDISSLEFRNYAGETALWRAMLAGSPQLSIELLHKGANPAQCGKVYVARWHRIPSLEEVDKLLGAEISTNGVSALFAPLLQQSSPYKYHTGVYTSSRVEHIDLALPFDINLLNKVMACSIYPVVDNTHHSELFTPQLVLDVAKVVSSETQFDADSIVPKGSALQEIGPLLFGNIKAGLQQLCIRQIIHHVLFKNPISHAFELINKLKGSNSETKTKEKITAADTTTQAVENWDDTSEEEESPKWNFGPTEGCPHVCDIMSSNYKGGSQKVNDSWNLVYKLSPSVVRKLVVSVLGLPPALVPYFEIEAARLQIGAAMYTYEHISNMTEWEAMSYEGSTDPFYDVIDDDDVFAEGHHGNGGPDDNSDFFDEENYGYLVYHPERRTDASFSFASSPSTSSEDILYPVRNEGCSTKKSSDVQMGKSPECADSDDCEMETKITENTNEIETPGSDNCSSGDPIPSDVTRDQYQKLTSEFCSTSSSNTSVNSITNNK